jgi:hypothetical protein
MKIAWSKCARAFGVSAMTFYRQRDRRRFIARNDSRRSESKFDDSACPNRISVAFRIRLRFYRLDRADRVRRGK